MPNIIELDSSIKEENPTIILGKNILLKIIENPEKQTLLKNGLVKKFLTITNLCNGEIRNLVDDLIQQDAFLTAPTLVQAIMKEKGKIEALGPSIALLQQLFKPITESKFFKTVTKKELTDSEKWEKTMLERKDVLADYLLRIKGQIDERTLKKHENRLLSIDRELEKKTGLRIAVASVLFVCSKCKVILGGQEIAQGKCFICNRKITERNIERLPIYKVPDEIKSVWFSNLWFEAYVAGLLRKLGCKTWTGVHVMGASGMMHEVDVLAIKGGWRF